jgi:hypothetical protein
MKILAESKFFKVLKADYLRESIPMMKSNLIVEKWTDNFSKYDFFNDTFGYCCDSCKFKPEVIYCCWLNDWFKARHYLRYLCKACLDKIQNTNGYLANYIEICAIDFVSSFPDLVFSKDIIVIAKNFIIKKNNECVKKNL